MNRTFETKARLTVGDEGAIEGVAWPFGTPDRTGDIIVKGAFGAPSLPLPMLAFHRGDDPVGAWDAIEETDDGLVVKGRLLVDEVPRAREVLALVKAGAVRGLSIGFETKSMTPRRGGGRTITALGLVEISLVSVPAHPRARITSAKSGGNALRIADAINRAATALRAR